MNQSHRNTLCTLRERLAGLPPLPWEGIEAWAASALPFFRTALPEHLDDFLAQTKMPSWAMLPRFGGGGDLSMEPEWDNSASASAAEERINRSLAERSRQNVLAWLDGLVAYGGDDSASTLPSAENRLLALLDRVPAAVRTLAYRSHSRPPLALDDEYDLQYLLHALLTATFRDVRPEEWTPSYAGTSSRMDFLLKPDRIVLEVKHTRPGLRDRDVADELTIDRQRYASHPDCGLLVCFVYDPTHRLRNPEALERDLSHDTSPRTVASIRPV